jgi:sigma-B regulation protein RsbU (phosphoserine phosphatase)
MTVLEHTNQRLLEMNAQGLFVTVLYGLLDRKKSTFTYARAGHELPIICSATGDISQPSMQLGQPLGILDKPALDEQELHLQPGSLLILYTDGLTDERNPQGEKFGIERLLTTTEKLAGLSAEQASDDLLGRVINFLGGTSQDDDLTLVIARSKR